MRLHTKTPGKSFPTDKGKDSVFLAQKVVFYNYLLEHLATATMVTDATGIPQKNITRYKRDLEKVGRLKEVKEDYCKSTGHKASYLTCNPDLFPQNRQLGLFN